MASVPTGTLSCQICMEQDLMVVHLQALPSSLDMVLPSAGMVELSGIALLSRNRMGLASRGWVEARSVSGTIFMEHSPPRKRRLCRLEDFGLPLQWRVNPLPLPSPWTLMIRRPAVVMDEVLPNGRGAAAGRRRGGVGGQLCCCRCHQCRGCCWWCRECGGVGCVPSC